MTPDGLPDLGPLPTSIGTPIAELVARKQAAKLEARIAELERLNLALAEHLAAAAEALGVLAERPTRDPFRFSRCHACIDESAAIFWLPRGCAAFPDVRLQPLCVAHIVKSAPLGGMYLLVNRLRAGSDPLPGFAGEGVALPEPGIVQVGLGVVHYAPYGRNMLGTFDCGNSDGGYTGNPGAVTCDGCKAKSPGLWPPRPGALTAAMDALYDAGGSGWDDVADPAKLLGRSESMADQDGEE